MEYLARHEDSVKYLAREVKENSTKSIQSEYKAKKTRFFWREKKNMRLWKSISHKINMLTHYATIIVYFITGWILVFIIELYKRKKTKKRTKKSYEEMIRWKGNNNTVLSEEIVKMLDDTPTTPEKEIESQLFQEYFVRRDQLMTQTETIFFNEVRRHLSGSGHYVFPKVRIADLVILRHQREFKAKRAFHLIQAKHMDFVITNTRGKIIACIELDDCTHKEWNRNDHIKDLLMQSIDMPLIRYQAWPCYDFSKLPVETITQ